MLSMTTGKVLLQLQQLTLSRYRQTRMLLGGTPKFMAGMVERDYFHRRAVILIATLAPSRPCSCICPVPSNHAFLLHATVVIATTLAVTSFPPELQFFWQSHPPMLLAVAVAIAWPLLCLLLRPSLWLLLCAHSCGKIHG